MKLQDLRVDELITPGIYEIQCISNKKVYIGETEELLARLGKHSSSLKQNQHDCKQLQEDCNPFGKEKFTFKVICFGDAYSSLAVRRKKEKEIIKQRLNESVLLYNIDNSASFTRNYQRNIEIDGKLYNSIAQAAKDIGIGETTIRRRLVNVKYPSYKDVRYKEKIYKIKGKLYKTIDKAFEDNVGGNRQTIRRRINSTKPKWADNKNYQMINFAFFSF